MISVLYRFQPTELSKIIIILFFARFFMDHEESLNTFRTIAKAVVLLAVPLFLIYEQPDMKNTIMILALFCILIYIAGNQLPDHRRSSADRDSSDDHFPGHRCPA